MSKPREAWYPYIKNICRRYPENKHPEENRAVSEALEQATPDEVAIIQNVYIKQLCTLREMSARLYISYPTARRKAARFIESVAKILNLPAD